MSAFLETVTWILALLLYSYALIAAYSMVLSSLDPGTSSIPWWKRLGLSLIWLALMIQRIREARKGK